MRKAISRPPALSAPRIARSSTHTPAYSGIGTNCAIISALSARASAGVCSSTGFRPSAFPASRIACNFASTGILPILSPREAATIHDRKIHRMTKNRVTIMGSYVADVAFRIDRLPTWGETRMGQFFQLGPGGKGSNQAVAAARAGANVAFISKLGPDPFGDMARTMYRKEGIDTQYIFASPNPTGAAAILIDAARGENAIIVVPGACFELTPAEVDQATALIASSSIFVTQLELPLPTVEHGLRLAHTHGIPTILNPAPVATLPDSIYPLCDYLTPNETEASALTGIPVTDLASAEEAASSLLALGVRNVILTLGAQGALIKTPTLTRHIPA